MQAQQKTCFISNLVESFRFDDGKLPSLPSAVIYLEKAIREDTVSLRELSQLLEKDPVLAARLIRVANSPYYRGVSAVETVPDAVTRVGFAATRNIALVLLGNSFHARHSAINDKVSELWVESLKTAAMAAALTRFYPLVDANRAMLGGLMYNVGAMLLLTIIDEKVEGNPTPMMLDEMVANHAPLFGYKLLEHWEMDPDLLAVGANRDNWSRVNEGSPDLADLVLVSRLCVRVTGESEPDLDQCEKTPSFQRMSQFLKLTQPLSQVVSEAEEAIEKTLSMLST